MKFSQIRKKVANLSGLMAKVHSLENDSHES
jgi:hypothetical protein